MLCSVENEGVCGLISLLGVPVNGMLKPFTASKTHFSPVITLSILKEVAKMFYKW